LGNIQGTLDNIQCLNLNLVTDGRHRWELIVGEGCVGERWTTFREHWTICRKHWTTFREHWTTFREHWTTFSA
jgi:hypothetical protein